MRAGQLKKAELLMYLGKLVL